MLENWCWEAETLQQLSGHYKDTSKPLPVALADALQASKKEHTGLFTLRQLMFGSFDLTIHSKKPGEVRLLWCPHHLDCRCRHHTDTLCL